MASHLSINQTQLIIVYKWPLKLQELFPELLLLLPSKNLGESFSILSMWWPLVDFSKLYRFFLTRRMVSRTFGLCAQHPEVSLATSHISWQERQVGRNIIVVTSYERDKYIHSFIWSTFVSWILFFIHLIYICVLYIILHSFGLSLCPVYLLHLFIWSIFVPC